MKSSEPQDQKTMKLIAEISSQILECLDFTWDTPSMNKNQRMPVLDTQIWVGEESRIKTIPEVMGERKEILKTGRLKKIILFEFYKKSMANKCPNLYKSGIPDGSKRATASNEILRRLKNTSRELEDDTITSILKEYMSELALGGYPEIWRVEILRAAITGYKRLWNLEASGKAK